MKRFIFFLSFLFSCIPLSVWAQDDIEVTDSTSTEWSGGGGGGLSPNLPTGPVTSISLSQTTALLAGGNRVKLVATVNKDAQNKKVLWSTSNNKIASVDDNGTVRALSKGSATITARAAGNTSLTATCLVTVTTDYKGMFLPDVPFEFCYNAADYDAATHCIPNHAFAQISDASLQLSENIPTLIDGEFLRITDRCEGYINRWEKNSNESGAYFYREGTDCMTIVAKVAPKISNNASDFICNRGGGYNYMWRIGSDLNSSFLHTGTAWNDGSRALLLPSEEAQVLAVRVDGPNDFIILQNLTTGDTRKVNGINWGGGNNVFKLFYNDSNEFFTGDFYWVYYSFEYLTDAQLEIFKDTMLKGDVNGDGNVSVIDVISTINYILQEPPEVFNKKAADVNGDGEISVIDVISIIDIILNKQ